jgi:hypothetical protein
MCPPLQCTIRNLNGFGFHPGRMPKPVADGCNCATILNDGEYHSGDLAQLRNYICIQFFYYTSALRASCIRRSLGTGLSVSHQERAPIALIPPKKANANIHERVYGSYFTGARRTRRRTRAPAEPTAALAAPAVETDAVAVAAGGCADAAAAAGAVVVVAAVVVVVAVAAVAAPSLARRPAAGSGG